MNLTRSDSNQRMNKAISLYRRLLKNTALRYDKVSKSRLYKINELYLLAELFNINTKSNNNKNLSFTKLKEAVYKGQKGRKFMNNILQKRYNVNKNKLIHSARIIQNKVQNRQTNIKYNKAKLRLKEINNTLRDIPKSYTYTNIKQSSSPKNITLNKNSKRFKKGIYTLPSIQRLNKQNIKQITTPYEYKTEVLSYYNKNGVHPTPEPYNNHSLNNRLNYDWQQRKPPLKNRFLIYENHVMSYLQNKIPNLTTNQYLYKTNQNFRNTYKKHIGINKEYTKDEMLNLIYTYINNILPGDTIRMYFKYKFKPEFVSDLSFVSKRDIYTIKENDYIKHIDDDSGKIRTLTSLIISSKMVEVRQNIPEMKQIRLDYYYGKKNTSYDIHIFFREDELRPII